jgi:hypothetical protein
MLACAACLCFQEDYYFMPSIATLDTTCQPPPGRPSHALSVAGKDCTTMFAHTGHSIRALKMFSGMQIGVLEGYTGPPEPKHEMGCSIQ